MEKQFILETEVLLTDAEVFCDPEEHPYNVYCTDGFAFAERADDTPNAPSLLKLTYPTLDEVRADEDMAHEVLVYRDLYDRTADDITYGDIMMRYGTIVKD